MEPHMCQHDKHLFYKYLDASTVYFEFGCGGSTVQASLRKNVKHIYFVESDVGWFNTISDTLKLQTNITPIFIDIESPPNSWGMPGVVCTNSKKIKYSNAIRSIDTRPDLILIDGRFRVACALRAFSVIDDETHVIFDDFLNRPEYHIVLDFYDIVEQTEDNCMVVLKKKKGVSPNKQLIQFYSVIPH